MFALCGILVSFRIFLMGKQREKEMKIEIHICNQLEFVIQIEPNLIRFDSVRFLVSNPIGLNSPT